MALTRTGGRSLRSFVVALLFIPSTDTLTALEVVSIVAQRWEEDRAESGDETLRQADRTLPPIHRESV